MFNEHCSLDLRKRVMWKKTYFQFIYDYYKTGYALYIALYFILIDHSEVKLRLFFLIRYAEKKLRKLCLKLEFCLQKIYSVFLGMSVLHNYM